MNTNETKNGIALVMISIDRSSQGKTNYLATTLENLNRSMSAAEPHIPVYWAELFLSTPNCAHFTQFTHWFDRVDIPITTRNACENAGAALISGGRQALDRNLAWVLFCEDDLDFCDDFIGSVSRWLDDYDNVNDPRASQYRVFSFGAAYPQVAELARELPAGSSWHYPYRAFYGTQCFAIRPFDAISLGTYIASSPLVRGVYNPNAYDLMFHDWMSANYPDGAFLASVPSFVQHIGRQSICTGKEITHTFESWPGREWSYRGRGKSSNLSESTQSRVTFAESRNRNPCILFVGDSPTVSTGFSLCTRQVCAHLHSIGWDVHVLGLSYFGDPHDYPYPIYPAVNPLDNSRDVYGCERLPKLIHAIRPDVVVLLNDPWNVEAYLFSIDRYERTRNVNLRGSFKLIGWLAVDGCNTLAYDFNHAPAKPDSSTKYGRLDHVAVWTEFASNELIKGGWDGPAPTVIPLGVDGDVFKPINKQLARERTLPEKIHALDPFVIGVVGRNQYRKRIDLCISYFADWIKREHIDDAYLYFHCAPTGDKGVDIRSLVRYHGIAGRVILTETCLGVGIDQADMATVYSSFNLLMTMTQGEGFGLTTLEAMSCGCPTLGPDWSGLGERGGWTENAMIRVACTSTALTAPVNGNMYTIGGIADGEQTIATLDLLYRERHVLDGFSKAGRELAGRLTWNRTVKGFEDMLRELLVLRSASLSENKSTCKIEVPA